VYVIVNVTWIIFQIMFEELNKRVIKRKRSSEDFDKSQESDESDESDESSKKIKKRGSKHVKRHKTTSRMDSKSKSELELNDDNNDVEIKIKIPHKSRLIQMKPHDLECVLKMSVQLAEYAYDQAQNNSVLVEMLKKQLIEQKLGFIQTEQENAKKTEEQKHSIIEESKRLATEMVTRYAETEKERMLQLTSLVEKQTLAKTEAEEKAFKAYEQGRLMGQKEVKDSLQLSEKLDHLSSQFSNLTGSNGNVKNKGVFGEKLVETWLETWFKGSGAEIKDVSAQSHSGDVIVVFPHPKAYNGSLPLFAVLLEIKYKIKIATTDVTKFHKDVDDNSFIAGALLVSIKSKSIPGHRDLSYAMRNTKMVGYIGNDEVDSNGRDIRSAILLMRAMYYESGAKLSGNNIHEEHWKKVRIEAEINLRSLRPQLKGLSSNIKSVKKALNSLQKLDTELNKMVSWLEDSFNSY